MAYFRVYTYNFQDINRANWRVDILDDQATGGQTPFELLPSEVPLVIETLESSDNKMVPIIGAMATLQYEYLGRSGEPNPDLFFDSDERRFRVEVYKNEAIYGVYYIKPDGGQYDDKYPPYTVTLTAVDGLAFIKGLDWNAYSNGLFDYRIMPIYEIIRTRGLDKIIDSTVPINVINTLRPENAAGNRSMLNDLFIHSDMFIDFTKGPDKIYDVLEKQLKSFSSTLFISDNAIWIRRAADIYNNTSITAEHYLNGVLSQLPLPNIVKTIGPSENANDGVPVDFNATNNSFPAIKELSFNLQYRGINVLKNFLWDSFDGTNFQFWRKQAPLTVTRSGLGTIDSPYAAFLNYIGERPPEDVVTLSQGSSGTNDMFCRIGDVFQCSFKYKFVNTSSFNIAIYMLDESNGEQYSLDGSGSWIYTTNAYPNTILMGRSGNKQDGSFEISSQPIPPIIQEKALSGNQMRVFFAIYNPNGLNSLDTGSPGVSIYPVKMSIYPISSSGRYIVDKNDKRVSQVLSEDEIFFMDTGVSRVSNSIFVDNAGTTAKKWASASFPAMKEDIEKHTADSIIDQYSQAVRGWEGSIRSNNIEFWNIFVMTSKPGRRFIMTKDKYDVRRAIHDCNLQEILPENSANTIYTEIDIEDSNK